jgi:hypothetical protein
MTSTTPTVLQFLILKFMWRDHHRDDRASFERHDPRLRGFATRDVLSALNRLEREGFIAGDRLGDEAGFQLTAAGRIMGRALGAPLRALQHSRPSLPPGYC